MKKVSQFLLLFSAIFAVLTWRLNPQISIPPGKTDLVPYLDDSAVIQKIPKIALSVGLKLLAAHSPIAAHLVAAAQLFFER